VFIGSLGLFSTKACVGEISGSLLLYLLLYALIPYMLATNAFIFALNSVVQKLVACCPRECSWSLVTMGTVAQVCEVFS
jgi:hypothetical protein